MPKRPPPNPPTPNESLCWRLLLSCTNHLSTLNLQFQQVGEQKTFQILRLIFFYLYIYPFHQIFLTQNLFLCQFSMACSATSTSLLSSNPTPKFFAFNPSPSHSTIVPSSFNGLRNCKPLVSRVPPSVSSRVSHSKSRSFLVRASVSYIFAPFPFFSWIFLKCFCIALW